MTNSDRVRFTLRIPGDLYKWLSDEAGVKGLTVNALLTEIFWAHIKAKQERTQSSA
jgi:hypothetical protein